MGSCLTPGPEKPTKHCKSDPRRPQQDHCPCCASFSPIALSTIFYTKFKISGPCLLTWIRMSGGRTWEGVDGGRGVVPVIPPPAPVVHQVLALKFRAANFGRLEKIKLSVTLLPNLESSQLYNTSLACSRNT